MEPGADPAGRTHSLRWKNSGSTPARAGFFKRYSARDPVARTTGCANHYIPPNAEMRPIFSTRRPEWKVDGHVDARKLSGVMPRSGCC